MLRAVLILAAAALLGIAGWRLATGWHPSNETYPVQGLTVSQSEGAVDWPVVAAAGADFAYAVATEGAGARDRRFEANWTGIHAAGLRRGAIHLYSLCRLASDQADAFNTFVPAARDALPAALDLDYRPGCDARPDRAVLVDEIRRFLLMTETRVGKPMLLKLSRAIERDYRLSEAIPRNVWARGDAFPPAYAARAWKLWEATDFRRVDGVEGPVGWSVAAQ